MKTILLLGLCALLVGFGCAHRPSRSRAYASPRPKLEHALEETRRAARADRNGVELR